jgi:hypothetical protein
MAESVLKVVPLYQETRAGTSFFCKNSALLYAACFVVEIEGPPDRWQAAWSAT